jgi:hypothetical protein
MMETIQKPTPDKAAILAALQVLFEPGDVIELRAIHKGKKRTDAGYFDSENWPQLADYAASWSTSGAAVYVTLNPVDPQLLGRYNNRIQNYADATTTDKQIVRRRWLLIDLDPVRPCNSAKALGGVDHTRCRTQSSGRAGGVRLASRRLFEVWRGRWQTQ